jgi:hypothetical protein
MELMSFRPCPTAEAYGSTKGIAIFLKEKKTSSKSNGIDGIPPMPNGTSLRKYQRHSDLSERKKQAPLCLFFF